MAQKKTVVVLDGVRSGNNVGSFFRTADAFGAARMVLCGITGTPPHAEIRKTALGAEQTVEGEYVADAADAVRALRGEGYTVLAVEQAAGSVMLQDFVVEAGVRYALVFGNEVEGVSPRVLSECSGVIEIPQVGSKKSLNVAVAGGVALWHFRAR
jgi:tRNA G18 (ribose-2'-O)-methylase SpoU